MTYKDLTPAQQNLLLQIVTLNGRLAQLANELREVANHTDEMIESGRASSAFVNARTAMELAEAAEKRAELANSLRINHPNLPENITEDALKMDAAAFVNAHMN